jgi:hypothetical protein
VLVVYLPVDLADFIAPLLPIPMLHQHDLVMRPMQVIGDEGYLLV